MSIRQSPPFKATEQVGYVEEIGWSEGPIYFPWVQAMVRNQQDQSASRGSYATPELAIAAAVAISLGWDINRVGVLMEIVAMHQRVAP